MGTIDRPDRTGRSPVWGRILGAVCPLSVELLIRLVLKWPLQWPAQCRWFRQWRDSFDGSITPLERGRPWLPFDLIERLDGELDSTSSVFEFGSGGSTLFFGRRAGSVMSVEHDPDWADRVQSSLAKKKWDHVELYLEEPESGPADRFGSDKAPYRDRSFEQYVRVIDEVEEGSLDVLLVDGRARSACVSRGRSKVANGGWLILDDVQRDRYSDAVATLTEQWGQPDVYDGLTPGARGPRPTAVFTKP